MLAGMVERVRRGQDFDGITDAVMLATRASITLGHIDSEPAKPLEAAVNAWFARRPDLAETYARKMIEPQMRLPTPPARRVGRVPSTSLAPCRRSAI